ncbi:hypothetical protein H4R33_002336 [Dimargaris cristalligena]|nr:hypothetical protein H4R33_002336 [Dimargaris cristalligena]
MWGAYNHAHPELIRTSRVIAGHIASHPNEIYNVPYRMLKDGLVKCATNKLTPAETREILLSWHYLLHHQIAGSIFAHTFGIWGGRIRFWENFSQAREHYVPLSLIRGVKYFLDSYRYNPLFNKNQWRFVKPTELSHELLAQELPLLALVNDPQLEGRDILEVFRTLTHPSLFDIMQKGQEMPVEQEESDDIDQPLQTLIDMIRNPDVFQGGAHLYARIVDSAATVLMTYLVTQQRFTDLQTFVEGLPHTFGNFWNLFQPTIMVGALQRLAIILAAMVRNGPLLNNLPDSFIHTSVYIPPFVERSKKCALVYEMYILGLDQDAAFLESALNCPESHLDDLPSWERAIIAHQLGGFMEQIRLLDNYGNGHESNGGVSLDMGVAVRITEFELGDQNRLSDTGPWPFYEPLWDFDWHISDDQYYNSVKHGVELQDLVGLNMADQ